MLINSQFKDFYDSIQQFGQDTDFVYNRFTKSEKYVGETFFSTHTGYFLGSAYSSRSSLINNYYVKYTDINVGFCGKVYRGLELEILNKGEAKPQTYFCYDLNQFEEIIKRQHKDVVEKYFGEDTRKRRYRTNYYYSPVLTQKYFHHVDMFPVFENETILSIFQKNYCPIFTIQKREHHDVTKQYTEITYNPQLSDLEFFRKFDSFQAYQNVRMFMSNLAVPMKPIPEISDKIMVEIKGFDPKYSFRKGPTSNKKRKKAR